MTFPQGVKVLRIYRLIRVLGIRTIFRACRLSEFSEFASALTYFGNFSEFGDTLRDFIVSQTPQISRGQIMTSVTTFMTRRIDCVVNVQPTASDVAPTSPMSTTPTLGLRTRNDVKHTCCPLTLLPYLWGCVDIRCLTHACRQA